jgi:hypothetical protein
LWVCWGGYCCCVVVVVDESGSGIARVNVEWRESNRRNALSVVDKRISLINLINVVDLYIFKES